MNVPLTEKQIKMYNDRRAYLNSYLNDIQLQVNNNQYGCAVAATCQRKPRSIVAVPPGKGKSRIIAALIALKYDFSKDKRFTILYSSELLKSADEAKFRHLEKLLYKSEIHQVVFNPDVPIREQVDETTFLLVDEADTIFLDHAVVPANKNIIALSATVVTPELNTEYNFLQNNKFHCTNSHIAGFINPDTAWPRVTVAQFRDKSAEYAKLIYDPANMLKDAPNQLAITDTNCRDLHRLKNLTKDDTMVVTDAELMRGVDYRSSTGISLLIMGPFASTRAFVQGLGRVGRYTERCQRFLHRDLQSPVDANSQAGIIGLLKSRSKKSTNLSRRDEMMLFGPDKI